MKVSFAKGMLVFCIYALAKVLVVAVSAQMYENEKWKKGGTPNFQGMPIKIL